MYLRLLLLTAGAVLERLSAVGAVGYSFTVYADKGQIVCGAYGSAGTVFRLATSRAFLVTLLSRCRMEFSAANVAFAERQCLSADVPVIPKRIDRCGTVSYSVWRSGCGRAE